MSTPEDQKMSARKLLKLPPALLTRLNAAAAVADEDANEIVRRAVVTELDKMDTEAGVEKQRMEKLRRIAQAKGADVDAALDELLKQYAEPELPGVTVAA